MTYVSFEQTRHKCKLLAFVFRSVENEIRSRFSHKSQPSTASLKHSSWWNRLLNLRKDKLNFCPSLLNQVIIEFKIPVVVSLSGLNEFSTSKMSAQSLSEQSDMAVEIACGSNEKSLSADLFGLVLKRSLQKSNISQRMSLRLWVDLSWAPS